VRRKFQTAITGELLVQTLDTEEFINPQEKKSSKHALTCLPTIVTHLLQSNKVFFPVLLENRLVLVHHITSHVMLAYQA